MFVKNRFENYLISKTINKTKTICLDIIFNFDESHIAVHDFTLTQIVWPGLNYNMVLRTDNFVSGPKYFFKTNIKRQI